MMIMMLIVNTLEPIWYFHFLVFLFVHPIRNLNIEVSSEGDKATYMDIPLFPETECLEHSFPPTLSMVSVLLTFLGVS